MQLFKDDDGKTPPPTPEPTPVTSGDEDGAQETETPSEEEVNEETPAATPNGPIPSDPPKSILKKKDLEGEESQESEGKQVMEDGAESQQ